MIGHQAGRLVQTHRQLPADPGGGFGFCLKGLAPAALGLQGLLQHGLPLGGDLQPGTLPQSPEEQHIRPGAQGQQHAAGRQPHPAAPQGSRLGEDHDLRQQPQLGQGEKTGVEHPAQRSLHACTSSSCARRRTEYSVRISRARASSPRSTRVCTVWSWLRRSWRSRAVCSMRATTAR